MKWWDNQHSKIDKESDIMSHNNKVDIKTHSSLLDQLVIPRLILLGVRIGVVEHYSCRRGNCIAARRACEAEKWSLEDVDQKKVVWGYENSPGSSGFDKSFVHMPNCGHIASDLCYWGRFCRSIQSQRWAAPWTRIVGNACKKGLKITVEYSYSALRGARFCPILHHHQRTWPPHNPLTACLFG